MLLCCLVEVDELSERAEGGRAILLDELVVVGGSIRPPPDTDDDEPVREEVGFTEGTPARREEMDMPGPRGGGKAAVWVGERGLRPR